MRYCVFLNCHVRPSSQLPWPRPSRPMLTAPPLTVRLDLPAPCRVTFNPAASVMPRPFCFKPFVWARRLLLRRCPIVWTTSSSSSSRPSCNTEPLELVLLEYCPTASKSVCSPTACPCACVRRLRPFPSFPPRSVVVVTYVTSCMGAGRVHAATVDASQ